MRARARSPTIRRCGWPCYLWLCDGDIRKEKEQRTGNKPGGRPPKAPSAEPKDKDQVSLTDEDSRIMPSHDGFVQSYNAQASVDAETHLIVEQHITQQPNDKQEVPPRGGVTATASQGIGTGRRTTGRYRLFQ